MEAPEKARALSRAGVQVLFGFFEEKKEELKANVAEAAAKKDDAAERVVPESPGSSQEDNAEKVRGQAAPRH